MKKILTFLSVAAAAFGLVADDFYASATSFEPLTVGEKLSISVADDGSSPSPLLWYSTDTTENFNVFVKAYTQEDPAYVYSGGSNVRNTIFNGAGAAKYVDVETEASPLYRALSHCNQAAEPAEAFTEYQIPGAGLYLDTLVQFTPFHDEEFESELVVPVEGQDKFLIQMSESPRSTGVGTVTNMVVTAGRVAGDGSVVSRNFLVSLNGDSLVAKKWYRLTIHAIKDVTSNNKQVAGFVAYIDGVALTCDDEDYAEKCFADDFDVTTLTPTANKFFNAQQLFVSLITAGGIGCDTLKAVGFEGVGKADDVAIVTVENAPAFVLGETSFTAGWVKGVTSFRLTANGGTYFNVTAADTQGEAGSKQFTFPAGTTTITVGNIVVDEASGYEFAGLQADAGVTVNDKVFTVTDPSVAAGTVLATRANFIVGGKGYASLNEALADITGAATIKVQCDFDVAEFEEEYDGYQIDGEMDITLDLQGHTITDTDVGQDALFVLGAQEQGGRITVIDSIGGGKLVAASDEMPLFLDISDAGGIVIGDEDGAAAPTLDGMFSTDDASWFGTIYCGSFLAALNTDENEGFKWNEEYGSIPEGSTYGEEPEGDYWVVSRGTVDYFTLKLLKGTGISKMYYEVWNGVGYDDPVEAIDNVAVEFEFHKGDKVRISAEVMAGYDAFEPVEQVFENRNIVYTVKTKLTPVTYTLTLNQGTGITAMYYEVWGGTAWGTKETAVDGEPVAYDFSEGDQVRISADVESGYQAFTPVTRTFATEDIELTLSATPASTWPMPALPESPTAADVTTALASSDIDQSIKDFIGTDAELYNSFRDWAIAASTALSIDAFRAKYALASYRMRDKLATVPYVLSDTASLSIVAIKVSAEGTVQPELKLFDDGAALIFKSDAGSASDWSAMLRKSTDLTNWSAVGTTDYLGGTASETGDALTFDIAFPEGVEKYFIKFQSDAKLD